MADQEDDIFWWFGFDSDSDDSSDNMWFDDDDEPKFSWFGDDWWNDNWWSSFWWFWDSWNWWWNNWWFWWWNNNWWWFWWWQQWWFWWNWQWWQQWWFWWDDNPFWSDMFWSDWWQWNYATRREAYMWWFKWNWEQIQIKPSAVWFMWSIKKLWEININIYKELWVFNYIFLWIFALIWFVWIYLVKELLIYFISYSTVFFQWFVWMDKFVVLIIYYFWLFILLNYLDWRSKLLNTVQAPIKVLLMWWWIFYLLWTISSDILFTIFVIWVFPLFLMKLFMFNETDTYILDKIKKWASIEDTEVKEEINSIINKASDSLLWDLPEQQDLLIWETESEEESYQLWYEMLIRNKEVKKASWFLVWSRMNLYYLNYYEEEMPEI